MKKYRFFIIIIILLVTGLLFSGSLNPARDILNFFTYPVAKIFTNSTNKITDFFANIESIKNLSQENTKLKNDNLVLKSQISRLNEVKHENEILKKELNFSQTQKDYELIPTQIIGRSPSSFLKSFKLDKGSNDGIELGKAVLSQGFLVGKISQVTSNTSEVEIINNSNSLIPVLLQNSRGTGLLKGGLSGLLIEDISTDIQIKTRESIVTSGLGATLPIGIPVGTVEKIISTGSEIFQRVTVLSPLELNKLEIVFVIK